MFIRNRRIRSLIFLACAAAVTIQPVSRAAQQPPDRFASARGVSEIPLQFTNADMSEFVRSMADLLGLRPMLVDSSLQGSVDFSISIPRNELWELFNGILRSKNAALIRQNNIYQVVPIATAIRNNLEIIYEQPMPGAVGSSPEIPQITPPAGQGREPEILRTLPVATHVVHLDFLPVDDIVAAAGFLLSEGVQIITFKRLNIMIFTDYSDNAARVREIVRMLDNSFLDPENVELVKIEYSNAVDVAAELSVIFGLSSGPAPGGGGTASSGATGISFVPLERLNAIFVMASSKHALDTAKRWISNLDTSENNKFQTYVYVVQDSTASNIAALLLALFGDGSSGSSATGTGRNTQGTAGTGRNTGSAGSLINQALGLGTDGSSTFGTASQLGPRLGASTPSVTSITLGSGEFSSLMDTAQVVIDEINNKLHIQSTPADYRTIENAIKQMDVPPKQVLIEAQIFEVNMNNDLTYGIRGLLEELGDEARLTTVGMGSTDERFAGSLTAQTFARVGNSRQIMLAIDALKTKTKIKNLSRPSVLAMDGTPASLVSGLEVPYPTGSYLTTGGSSTSIDYRETGITLIVVPKISASGTVTMEIVQEVSNLSDRAVPGIDAPIVAKNTVTTTLSVKDGDTAVIAGMMHDMNTSGRAGIPLLSDIPIIGSLFAYTSRSNDRRELIILITPRVIHTQDKFQEITQGMRDSLRNVGKFADEYDENRIRDIEDARQDREKKELENIRKIKPSK